MESSTTVVPCANVFTVRIQPDINIKHPVLTEDFMILSLLLRHV